MAERASGPLDGRVALVTGGGRGIGAAVARALAAAGARVAVLARTAEQVRAVAAQVGGLALAADVTDQARLDAAVRRTAGELGPPDVLVANAGVVQPLGRPWQLDPDAFAAAVQVNLGGAFRSVAAVLPGMVGRGYGRIVTVTSGAAEGTGMASAAAYSASKAGLEALTVNLAADLAGTGVTVNAVRPGTVDTAMQDAIRAHPRERVGAALHDRFQALKAHGGLVDPAVPAGFVARLVSTDLTGKVYDVRRDRLT